MKKGQLNSKTDKPIASVEQQLNLEDIVIKSFVTSPVKGVPSTKIVGERTQPGGETAGVSCPLDACPTDGCTLNVAVCQWSEFAGIVGTRVVRFCNIIDATGDNSGQTCY